MSVSMPQKSETGLPSDLEACHSLIRELVFLLESKDADIACLKERLSSIPSFLRHNQTQLKTFDAGIAFPRTSA